MAIKRSVNALNTDEFQVVIDNGDLNALEAIRDKWKFKDKESALRFALAVLALTQNGTLLRQHEDGTTKMIIPSDDILDRPPS